MNTTFNLVFGLTHRGATPPSSDAPQAAPQAEPSSKRALVRTHRGTETESGSHGSPYDCPSQLEQHEQTTA